MGEIARNGRFWPARAFVAAVLCAAAAMASACAAARSEQPPEQAAGVREAAEERSELRTVQTS
ncbi:MAG: hypothetical protein N3B11_06135, partial [Coriobacteriia bacterium]|nr:hypothetical protein [Coriobacteriia bacterium]